MTLTILYSRDKEIEQHARQLLKEFLQATRAGMPLLPAVDAAHERRVCSCGVFYWRRLGEDVWSCHICKEIVDKEEAVVRETNELRLAALREKLAEIDEMVEV